MERSLLRRVQVGPSNEMSLRSVPSEGAAHSLSCSPPGNGGREATCAPHSTGSWGAGLQPGLFGESLPLPGGWSLCGTGGVFRDGTWAHP